MRYRCGSCNSVVEESNIVRSSEGFQCNKCCLWDLKLDKMILQGKLDALQERR